MSSESDTSRRGFLAGAAALVPVASAMAQAALQAGDTARTTRDDAPHGARTPSFFSAAEWVFLNAACARLIPADENGPGAVELGVPHYIDRQMYTPWATGGIWYMQEPFFEAAPEFGYQSSLTPQQQYRLGIRAIDALCQHQDGRPFADLSTARQDEVLTQIEKGTLTATELSLRTFFISFLVKNTQEGFFGDPKYGGNKNMAAWKMIGYPGVRADFLEWVGVANPYPYGPVSINGERG